MDDVKEARVTATPDRPVAAPKRDRLDVRLSHEQKALFQQAAALEGRSLTDFMVTSAQRAAEQTIREHQVIALTARDSLQVAELLLDPPEPGPRLRAAVDEYRRTMGIE